MKRISRIIFTAIVFLTIFLCSFAVLNQPGDDIFHHSMDLMCIIVILTPILIVETELYSICVYGFLEEKNKTKTFLKRLSLVIALLFLGLFVCSFYITTNKIQTVLLVVFLLYVLSKILLLVFKGKSQNLENH